MNQLLNNTSTNQKYPTTQKGQSIKLYARKGATLNKRSLELWVSKSKIYTRERKHAVKFQELDIARWTAAMNKSREALLGENVEKRRHVQVQLMAKNRANSLGQP